MDGEPSPVMGDADAEAFKVVNLLKNGQGGLDWAGLPFVAAWLGIADIDGLMERLAVIISYKRNQDD